MGADTRFLLHFRTSYYTNWGENLVVCGPGVLFGNWDPKRGHWMTCHHVGEELVWEVAVPIPDVSEFTYKYAVVNEQLEVIKWESEQHTIALPDGLEAGAIIDIFDQWQDNSHPAKVLSRSAFSKVILSNKAAHNGGKVLHMKPTLNEAIVRFQICDWQLQEGQVICVTGGAPQLGNWQLQQVLTMTETNAPWWEAEVQVPLSALPITYKYAVRELDGSLSLEHGENRMVAIPHNEATCRAPALVVRNDGYFRHERRWRGAGVAIPVFALRSARSVGAGEFGDLCQLVDFCAAAGFRLIQLLPVNDTCVRKDWRDSYPYSSLCVFALHPLYLRLEDLSDHLPEGVAERIEVARRKLDLAEVDYEATMKVKLEVARTIFDAQGQETLQSKSYKEFCARNSEWLRPYAVFCFLRDLFGTAEHWKWGMFSTPTPELIDRLASPDQEWHATIQFAQWLQYHLHCQLLRVSQYAQDKGVALKGDLPIGVDKRSVDTWLYPKLFRMNVGTGAPPDYFNKMGQNWGFPTYNWEEMAKDGFLWWRRRLGVMAQYFHAYRIDHILGFFRIWEIPAGCITGLLGHFRPSLPLWRQELESKGIWDFDRLCDPYITWPILVNMFGDELAGEVACKYLTEVSNQRYKLRPQYATEAALNAIQPRNGLPEDLAAEVKTTREGLLKLRQNVVLLRDEEDKDKFYPRIALQETSSYRELDKSWREELARLHDDYYYHRQDALWQEHGHKTLPVLLGATDMLVCGEDLGMIPKCVHPTMEEMGIIGLRIQRMPSEANAEFGDPGTYPYMVVASPSCHDTTTTRAWWEEDPERRERYYYQVLDGEGPAPAACTHDIMHNIVQQHLDCAAIFTILPLQDIFALSSSYNTRPASEETINDPTNAEHYWRYRMHVKLEQLKADTALLKELQGMLLRSGRCQPADLPHIYAQYESD